RRAAPGALRLAGMDAAPAVRPRRRRAPGAGRGRRTMTATSGSFAEPSPTGPACTRRRPGYGEPERGPRGRGLPDRVAETAPPSPTIKEGAGGVGRLPRRARPTGHWGEFTLPDLPERISARELVRL